MDTPRPFSGFAPVVVKFGSVVGLDTCSGRTGSSAGLRAGQGSRIQRDTRIGLKRAASPADLSLSREGRSGRALAHAVGIAVEVRANAFVALAVRLPAA